MAIVSENLVANPPRAAFSLWGNEAQAFVPSYVWPVAVSLTHPAGGAGLSNDPWLNLKVPTPAVFTDGPETVIPNLADAG